jgi:hypothetical protein
MGHTLEHNRHSVQDSTCSLKAGKSLTDCAEGFEELSFPPLEVKEVIYTTFKDEN